MRAYLYILCEVVGVTDCQYEHVTRVRICPGLYRILVVTVLKWQTVPLLNKKELQMQRMEPLWQLSGIHPDILKILFQYYCRV